MMGCALCVVSMNIIVCAHYILVLLKNIMSVNEKKCHFLFFVSCVHAGFGGAFVRRPLLLGSISIYSRCLYSLLIMKDA